jgi:hypothetical protein
MIMSQNTKPALESVPFNAAIAIDRWEGQQVRNRYFATLDPRVAKHLETWHEGVYQVLAGKPYCGEVFKKAYTIAAQNRWEWSEVLRLSRKSLNKDEHWLSAYEAGLIDSEIRYLEDEDEASRKHQLWLDRQPIWSTDHEA